MREITQIIALIILISPGINNPATENAMKSMQEIKRGLLEKISILDSFHVVKNVKAEKILKKLLTNA